MHVSLASNGLRSARDSYPVSLVAATLRRRCRASGWRKRALLAAGVVTHLDELAVAIARENSAAK